MIRMNTLLIFALQSLCHYCTEMQTAVMTITTLIELLVFLEHLR